jgi:DNA-binding transcriptional ArsR family regulator
LTDTEIDHDATYDGGFIEPVAMEDDPDELFPGDRGVLDPEVRHVLVRLLQRRFLLADRNRAEWTVLLDHQQVIESRLHDLYVRLVIDHERGVAYKEQVREDDLEVPILLRDEPFTPPETLVLVHLRTVYQRETTAGETSARVDIEEVEQTVLSYFAETGGSTGRRQRTIRSAVSRLRQDGVITEESEGRYRISPLVEILLSAERLQELRGWLDGQALASAAIDDDTAPTDVDASDSEDAL